MKWLPIAFLLSFIPFYGDQPSRPGDMTAPVCYVNNDVFQTGEQFSMKVYYNWSALWVGAGEIHFKVKEQELDGKPVYHMDIVGQTYDSYEWFYKVDDRYESYMDKNSLKSVKFARNIQENKFTLNDEYNFDRDRDKVYVNDFKKSTKDTFQVDDCVHDIVSAIYFSRCIDFDQYQPGDKIPFSVFVDGQTYEVFMHYEGKQQIKTKTGRYNTFVVKTQLVANDYFDEDDNMTIYVSDDKNRLPVRLESPLTVGSMKAELKAYRGLLHPFTAKVD